MDLLQGTLDVLILKTLSWEPMHGYAISRWIRRRTDDVLTVEDAHLDQLLRADAYIVTRQARMPAPPKAHVSRKFN